MTCKGKASTGPVEETPSKVVSHCTCELQLNLLLIINIINNKLIKSNYYFKSFLVFKYLSKIVPTDFAVVLKLVLKYRLLEF